MVDTRPQTGVRGYGMHYREWALPLIRHVNRDEVLGAVMDPEWQRVRLSMKGMSTHDKLDVLESYWMGYDAMHEVNAISKQELHLVWVRVINYLTALKRGGQLSMEGRIQK